MRLVAALVLMPFCTAAFANCEDPTPTSGSNVACLDPTGPIIVGTPTKRWRTFGMNQRTMLPGTPNDFIVFQGQSSVGQFGNPEVTIVEYAAEPANPKNTRWEFAVSFSYGAQQQNAGGGGTYDIWFTLLDANLQPMDVRGTRGNIYFRCSSWGAKKQQYPDKLINRDDSFWNLLDYIRAIEFAAAGGGQNWTTC